MYIYLYICLHIRLHAQAHTRTHARTRTHMHTHTYAHIPIYTLIPKTLGKRASGLIEGQTGTHTRKAQPCLVLTINFPHFTITLPLFLL